MKHAFVTLVGAPALGFALLASAASRQFTALDWVALLPEEDYQALLSAPPIQHTGGDAGGAPAPLQGAPSALSFDEVLYSTKVRSEYDGQDVSLPGFIVPLEYDEDQEVTEFFLVPYFGACIHVPPPPPNQIVYVSFPEGIAVESIQEPFVVDGRLSTGITSNDVALAAYRIEAAGVRLYEE